MAIELVIFVIGGLILLLPSSPMDNKGSLSSKSLKSSIAEYPMILVFTTIGASFLVSSTDLVSLYLAIELQSFAAYILAALYRNSESATAAGLKYFLLGALSSAFILLGSSLIYGYTGLTNLDAISSLVSISSDMVPQQVGESGLSFSGENNTGLVTQGVILGLVIMTVGFLFKIASAPFHNWAPDVYDGVPTIVTTWLAVMPKISIFVLLLTLHSLTEGLGISVFNVFVVIGTVLGLAQFRIKRLLAYSTISHVGFMLLALAVSGQESIDGFLFYLIQYSLTSLNAFFIILAFGYLINSSTLSIAGGKHSSLDSNSSDIQFISQLSGQFRQNPILALSMIVCLFSMAGIPPLVGFFAKYAVLYSAIHNGYYFISIIAILASVVSAAYYLRVVLHRPDTEKVTPYECGFNPIYGQVRAPFAIQYYLVGILFLIFDLEIAVLYPLAVTLYQFGKGALKFTDHRSSINRTPL
ncbi:NADH dehydrogenase subunit 2 [Microbotryomycetes sp. JL221]|nr:NADH dehydrogenase subunit 2 [Microbotryomycetes sp. JL221]